MPSPMPLPPLITSALGLGLDAFVAARAAIGARIAQARAAFELTLTAPSADWGFLLLAGLDPVVDALERLRMRVDELDWLESVGAIDLPTRRLLAESRFACDVDAAPEGSVVFPGEAVLTVEGPYWQAQLVGGLLEASIVDATLVATRFARLLLASRGGALIESGAATAHRLGGAPLLARAAYIGGASATTSALAARRYGIPVIATEPLRFTLAPGDRDHAVRAWLAAAPREVVVRIDASTAHSSIPRLAAALKDRIRASGGGWDGRSVTIELSGGDRVSLAREVVRVFARAGLGEPPIAISGDVDERLVLELRTEGSPAMGFIARAEGTAGSLRLARYDLVAIESAGAWSPRMRADEGVASSSDPGRKLLVRFADAEGSPAADVAHSTNERFLRPQGGRFVDRGTGLAGRLSAASSAPLRASVMRAGKRATASEAASAIRERALRSVQALYEGHRRIVSPARYPVGMTPQLAALKTELLAKTVGD